MNASATMVMGRLVLLVDNTGTKSASPAIPVTISMNLLIDARKVFQYFHFNDIAGRKFLRADYRLLSDGDEWSGFLPLVLFVLVVFTIGLPGLIGNYLYVHSEELYSTAVIQRVGFLYSAYKRGAEFWQIHDVILKLVLTGVLIYVPSNTRPSAGILVMIVAIGNLNFFKPQRSTEIFWLTQLSFGVMITKYVIANLLLIVELVGSDPRSIGQLGILLIYLDIVMMLSSIITIYFLVRSLSKKMHDKTDVGSARGKRRGDATRDERESGAAPHALVLGESGVQRTLVVPVAGIAGVTARSVLANDDMSISYEQEIDELHRDHAFHEEALRQLQSKRQVRSKRKTEMRVAARLKVRKSKVLHQVELFSSMPESDINAVLSVTNFETFSSGTVICSQGDLAAKFYILVSGHCKVSVEQTGGDGAMLEVATLNPMQYFGEGCLEQVTQNRRRMASVTACESVQLLSLHRADLVKLIEQEVIRCNMIGMMRKTVRQRTKANNSILAIGKVEN